MPAIADGERTSSERPSAPRSIAPGSSASAASPSLVRGLVARALDLGDDELSCRRRGFDVREPRVRERLDEIGRAVLCGYRHALRVSPADELARALERELAPELRGFGFEGAAMGLALLDALWPWGASRWRAFARGAGAPHLYMLHVGAGLALARMRRRIVAARFDLDPGLLALVADGQGFHAGYFRAADAGRDRGRLAPELRHAFDQGLGRSAWFTAGAEPASLAAWIEGFAPERRSDLWSGIGLAAAYAGGPERAGLGSLAAAARGFELHLAQGAGFAAEARERAGNPAPHTELACQLLCRASAADVADLVRRARGAPVAGALDDYEAWRARVRAALDERWKARVSPRDPGRTD